MTFQTRHEFSLSAYQEMLEHFKSSGWRFDLFSAFGDSINTPQTVLLRHDIDAELYLLEPFLEVENRCNVRSTFFVMLESPLYNPFSPEGRVAIQRITDAGHNVCLHFFGEIHANLNPDELRREIMSQAARLSQLTQQKVPAFSFHQPTTEMIELDLEIPGMVNTYHTKTMRSLTYESDTNMDWRPASPQSVMAGGTTRIQLLIHPIWWIMKGSSPAGRWKQVIEQLSVCHARHLLIRERTLVGLNTIDLNVI